jgi:hypothetical protein
MQTVSKAIMLLVPVMALASCNTFSPRPTETPTLTATSLPTATHTPEPTNTPAQAPVLPMPSGKPASEWQGIPVMPDAIAGEGDNKGYSFTIEASHDEIQKFYEMELAKLGWDMFATGQGTTGAVLLIFMKDASTVSVSIIPQPDGIMFVLLVK